MRIYLGKIKINFKEPEEKIWFQIFETGAMKLQ